jgi:hypothetical protein
MPKLPWLDDLVWISPPTVQLTYRILYGYPIYASVSQPEYEIGRCVSKFLTFWIPPPARSCSA